MRIVYVEDNIANVHLVKRVARMGKHEIINYIDGMDAFNNFGSDNPDLVLMDIQLAGELTGIEVVKKLRDKGFVTPIYAVTAYAMVGDKERCMEAGCTGYISKPIPIPELVNLFNQYNNPTPPAITKTTDAPVMASSPATSTDAPVATSPATSTDAPVTASSPATSPDTAVVEEVKQDSPVTPDTKDTKTLVSLSNIKPEQSVGDKTESKKPASDKPDTTKDITQSKKPPTVNIKPDVASDDVTKSNKQAVGIQNKQASTISGENNTALAELDNDDTLSINKDKPAQMK